MLRGKAEILQPAAAVKPKLPALATVHNAMRGLKPRDSTRGFALVTPAALR
jgi:hypothetical protein